MKTKRDKKRENRRAIEGQKQEGQLTIKNKRDIMRDKNKKDNTKIDKNEKYN